VEHDYAVVNKILHEHDVRTKNDVAHNTRVLMDTSEDCKTIFLHILSHIRHIKQHITQRANKQKI